jgi:hypothetical protein
MEGSHDTTSQRIIRAAVICSTVAATVLTGLAGAGVGSADPWGVVLV